MSGNKWPAIRVTSNREPGVTGPGLASATTTMPCGVEITKTIRHAKVATAEEQAEIQARRSAQKHATSHGCSR